MKTMVLTLMVILLGFFSGKAQTMDTTEVQVGKSVYMKIHAYWYIEVWNKASGYHGKDYNYSSRLGHRITQVHDEEQVIQACARYLVDSVDNKVIAHNDEVVAREGKIGNSITLTFYADLNGSVKDVRIYYDENLDIPIEAIHKLFKKLLQSNIKLDFDIQNEVFKDAKFIVKEYFTSWKTLRQYAKTHK